MNDLTATIKSYLRRLPDPLVSSKVCDALIHIYECECDGGEYVRMKVGRV